MLIYDKSYLTQTYFDQPDTICNRRI